MHVQLETDSVKAGPSGHMVVLFKDAKGQVLATASSPQFARGGKPHGHAAIEDDFGHASIPPQVAAQAVSLEASVACGPAMNRWLNIDSGKITQAIDVAVKVVTAVGTAAQ